MSFHANAIRPHFPSLSVPAADGSLPVFLDNPAGTQVPLNVMQAVTQYYMTMNANSGGAFATSRRSDDMAGRTREAMADFLNASSPSEIVIGPNMTSLNFSLSRSIAQTLSPGDEIVLTRMDHDANIAPWALIARENDLQVKWVDINTADCTLDMDSLEEALSERTKVVATVQASNAVGTVNPVKQIAGMARAVGAWHVVDAVQSAPHLPIDVQKIGCDFLLCSSYKFYGPHLGIMWGRQELLDTLPAYKVRPAKDAAPNRWENGTPSYETWNGLLACLEHWESIGADFGDANLPHDHGAGRRLNMKRGMAAVRDYERQLVSALIDGLCAIPGVSIAGITDSARFNQRVPTVAMVKQGHSPDEIARYLAENHIYVWSGNYYAVEIMRRLNRPAGMVRIGIGQYNTIDEINKLLNLLDLL
ncbi:MAG: cysteine desulfurase-like protein [Chloroflexota bacterium]|nr:cysteine desulfurase-like protein [Chloroflexota bacterium]